MVANRLFPRGQGRLRSIPVLIKDPTDAQLARLADADRFLLAFIRSNPAEYVDHPIFSRPDAQTILFGGEARLASGSTWFEETARWLVPAPGNRAAARDREPLDFQRYNFCRMQIFRIVEAFPDRRLPTTELRMLLAWSHRAQMLRGQLAQANLGLVSAMVGKARASALDQDEAISVGNLALLRSIDRFDCAMGYRFSTYACQAILQHIIVAARKACSYRARFGTEYDETLERDRSVDFRHEREESAWLLHLREVFAQNRAHLNEAERTVIRRRFALGACESETMPMTLKQIGETMGLTKESVRQIQNRALAKLRSAMEREADVA